jgi:membrane fusion protein (multidrug efflux system)
MKFRTAAAVVLKKVLPAIVGLIVLVAVIAWLAGAFTKKIPAGQAPLPGDALADLQAQGTYKVEEISKDSLEEAIGTLKAASRTEISSRVLAGIDEITVGAGDQVAQDDVLIELDRKDFEAQLNQAEAALEATDAAFDQAEDMYNRAVRLRQTNPGAMAEQDFNQLRSNMLAARADRSRVLQAKAEAEVRLSYTTIKAPKSGTIVDRWAEEGDLAQPGVPLLSLYDRTSLRLEVPVMEELATKLQKGQPLEVYVDALNRDFRGVVDEKVPQAEAASRSFLVKVTLPPSDELYEGMFGRLRIPTGPRRHLCLHTGAIRQVGQLEFVIVEETVEDPVTGKPERRRERRFIKTGRYGDATHREVLSGLEAGEHVLLLGPEGPGQPAAPCPQPGLPGSGAPGPRDPTDRPPPDTQESTSDAPSAEHGGDPEQ